MKYNCECCKYDTNRKSSYDRHMSSKRHLDKLAIFEAEEAKSSDDSRALQKGSVDIICKGCGGVFKYLRNYTRHAKNCSKNLAIHEDYKKMTNDFSELKKNNKILQEKYELLVEKYDVKRDELEEMMIEFTKPDSNPNVFSFVEGNFLDTKPLEPIIDEDVPKISQMKEILDKKNGKMEMCNVLQHHSLHKTLENFVGDILRSIYEKADKKTQQFFVTDCSRLSYIIRDIVDKELVWRRDNKGIILARRIISPILVYIRNHLSDHMGKYLSYILDEFPNDKLESVDRIQRLTKIIAAIDSGKLQYNILKYLAFYFKLDKTILEKGKKKMIRKRKGFRINT